MSPYFTKIHLTDMFEQCHDYIKRGLQSQMSELKMGETEVDLVWYYGELFQFFLGESHLPQALKYSSFFQPVFSTTFHNCGITDYTDI